MPGPQRPQPKLGVLRFAPRSRLRQGASAVQAASVQSSSGRRSGRRAHNSLFSRAGMNFVRAASPRSAASLCAAARSGPSPISVSVVLGVVSRARMTGRGSRPGICRPSQSARNGPPSCVRNAGGDGIPTALGTTTVRAAMSGGRWSRMGA